MVQRNTVERCMMCEKPLTNPQRVACDNGEAYVGPDCLKKWNKLVAKQGVGWTAHIQYGRLTLQYNTI